MPCKGDPLSAFAPRKPAIEQGHRPPIVPSGTDRSGAVFNRRCDEMLCRALRYHAHQNVVALLPCIKKALSRTKVAVDGAVEVRIPGLVVEGFWGLVKAIALAGSVFRDLG